MLGRVPLLRNKLRPALEGLVLATRCDKRGVVQGLAPTKVVDSFVPMEIVPVEKRTWGRTKNLFKGTPSD